MCLYVPPTHKGFMMSEEKSTIDELQEILEQDDQLSDAYMDQEAFHKELDFAFNLIEREQSKRLYMKMIATTLVILSLFLPSDKQHFLIFTFLFVSLLGLECSIKAKICEYKWLYDWICVQRLTGDNSLRYNLDSNRFSSYGFDYVDLLDFESIPFYLLLWTNIAIFHFIG